MAWFRQNLLFAGLCVAAVAACVVQGWFTYTTRERARRAAIQLEAKRSERDWLARQSPALTGENARAIAADVAVAEKRLAALRAILAGHTWLTPAPVRPVEAYFALASFNEKMRALAARQQIALRAEERFGFATYANEGPESDLLGAVHRQRVVMQHVLETLFEARPRSLVVAVRERPLTDAQRAARHTASANAGAGDVDPSAASPPTRSAGQLADFFEADSRLRLQVPGLVDGELYRVEFTGQTPALRAFLNALATSPLPLFVRAVEVAPDAADAASIAGNVAAAETKPSAPVPLVAQNFSKFAVVLECVEVAPAAPASPP
jgi:hypothetical protein